MLAREVAQAAKLDSSHASAQLRLLADRGYVRDVRLPSERKTRYEVVDRFYNIYVLLRFSRGGRERLGRLVAFLQDLFGRETMRMMYPMALAVLESRGATAEEAADWLSVLTRYVASDGDFQQGETWTLRAIDVAKRLIGPDAPVIGEIERVGWTGRGVTLLEEGKFAEAAEAYRRAIVENRANWATYFVAGHLAFELNQFERTTTVLGKVADFISENDTSERRHIAALSLSTRMKALVKLDQNDEATRSCERLIRYVRRDDPDSMRDVAVKALSRQGDVLSKFGCLDEAVAVWKRVGEYARSDDPPALRRMAGLTLFLCGSELYELGRHDEAMTSWRRVLDYVVSDESIDTRFILAATSCSEGDALSGLGRDDEAVAAWKRAASCVFPDDPSEWRRDVSRWLAASADVLSFAGKLTQAETVCRLALDVTPECGEAWHVLAASIFRAKDGARLAEAEEHIRRALDLLPKSGSSLCVLAVILAVRGQWTEAMKRAEEALRLDQEDGDDEERTWLIALLISAVVTNHGRAVKEMMERTGVDRTMEPLWHAVRVDLGEEPGPLPAEIADVTNWILEEIARRRGQ